MCGAISKLVNVVSHTAIEIEALSELQAAGKWVDLARHSSRRVKSYTLGGATARRIAGCVGPGSAARPYVGNARSGRQGACAHRPPPLPQLGQAVGPCSHRHGVSPLSEAAARRTARAIDALRRGWVVAIGEGGDALSLMAIETGATAAVLSDGSAKGLLISDYAGGNFETWKPAGRRRCCASRGDCCAV